MRDYLLAVGDRDPYGFSSASDHAAIDHAIDTLGTLGSTSPGSDMAVMLSGPDGCLTRSDEMVSTLRELAPQHVQAPTNTDAQADPTPPDCNTA